MPPPPNLSSERLSGTPTDELRHWAAPPDLTSSIGQVVGYRMTGHPPGVHLGLPSTGITLVISLNGPIAIDVVGTSDDFDAPVGGLHTKPVRIGHDGTQFGVQIELSPLHAQGLLGMPISELSGQVVELCDLLPGGHSLLDRLHDAPDWDTRFTIVESVLRQATQPVYRTPEVAHAWDLLRLPGIRRVEDVADAVGWSRRHLTSRMRDAVGLTPKQIARISRFERSRTQVTMNAERGEGLTLARIASDCGFADHAHLTRDWIDLAGCAPSSWLAAEVLPFVQDAVPEVRDSCARHPLDEGAPVP